MSYEYVILECVKEGCSSMLKTCPICRSNITDRISKALFD